MSYIHTCIIYTYITTSVRQRWNVYIYVYIYVPYIWYVHIFHKCMHICHIYIRVSYIHTSRRLCDKDDMYTFIINTYTYIMYVYVYIYTSCMYIFIYLHSSRRMYISYLDTWRRLCNIYVYICYEYMYHISYVNTCIIYTYVVNTCIHIICKCIYHTYIHHDECIYQTHTHHDVHISSHIRYTYIESLCDIDDT